MIEITIVHFLLFHQKISKMKHIISLVFAGIIGGLITLGGIHFMQDNQQSSLTQPAIAQQINQSLLNQSPNSTIVPTNFTEAARRSMPAVVHITASESSALANKRRQDNLNSDPFQQFFGDC